MKFNAGNLIAGCDVLFFSVLLLSVQAHEV